jgi:hypothetical protein
MSTGPFMLRIFVPDGIYDGVRWIDRLNWSGLGVMVPRARWTETRHRPEFARPAVYLLTGASRAVGRPRIYVGQAENLRQRLDAHCQTKDFWDWAYVFTAKSDALNRAHITWLEQALIERALAVDLCLLENGKSPMRPELTEAELAEMQAFLAEILHILALVGVTAFAGDPAVRPLSRPQPPPSAFEDAPTAMDTLVVPAHAEGFETVFLRQHCWHAVRIAKAMLPQIRYLAIYRTNPICAVTHYARVARIVPHGESGKYRLEFDGEPIAMKPIPFADAPAGTLQGPRYTSLTRLHRATRLAEVFAGSLARRTTRAHALQPATQTA